MQEFPIIKKVRLTEEHDRKLAILAVEMKMSQASVVRLIIDKEYFKAQRLELIKECVEEYKAG